MLARLGDRTEGLKFPAVGAARMIGRLDAKKEIRRDLIVIVIGFCSNLVKMIFERRF